MAGWVKLYRSLLEWEWYDDVTTKTLFIHLLITANFKPTKWRGIDLDVGERVISRAGLAEETGLSERKIRTSLNRLKTSEEVTSKTTNGYTVIKLVNYCKYQGEASEDVTREATSERPGSDRSIRSKELKKKEKTVVDSKIYKQWIANETDNKEVQQAAADWLKMRVECNIPITEGSVHKAFTVIRKHTKDAEVAVAMFDQSTAACWRGVFPVGRNR